MSKPREQSCPILSDGPGYVFPSGISLRPGYNGPEN